MKIFVLSSYTDGLNDPVVSTNYENVYECMKRSYNLVLNGVSQMKGEKENTYLEAYSAQAVVHGDWIGWNGVFQNWTSEMNAGKWNTYDVAYRKAEELVI